MIGTDNVERNVRAEIEYSIYGDYDVEIKYCNTNKILHIGSIVVYEQCS